MWLGVRTWGNTTSGSTVMLIGTYERATEIGARVLGALPDRLVLPALDSPVVDLLGAEIDREGPGQEAVLSLAAACGLSRAAFARRFTERVGEPPMTFLTGWRPGPAANP